MKLIILCHGATGAMRIGGFPGVDDMLDDGAARKLAAGRLKAAAAVTGNTRAAFDTAYALGLSPTVVSALDDIDHGSWSGRSFADVQAESPHAFADWLSRPWGGTPDGETFATVCARVGPWMAAIDEAASDIVAIVSPMIVRAMIAEAIDLPAPAVMRIDVAPLTSVTLSRHHDWRLQRLGTLLGD